MTKFSPLSITTDKPEAIIASMVLEDAAIPVMVEHVDVEDEYNKEKSTAYRVMVPVNQLKSARKLVSSQSIEVTVIHDFDNDK